MASNCKNILDVLCNVCGLHTPKNHQKAFNENLKAKYLQKFNVQPTVDINYTPASICNPCSKMLLRKPYNSTMVTPTIWRKPDTNHERCYACLMPPVTDSTWNNRHNLDYPLPEQTTTTRATWRAGGSNNQRNHLNPSPDVHQLTLQSLMELNEPEEQDPVLITQDVFNGLCRELELTRDKAELLFTWLRTHDVLEEGVTNTF